MCTAYWASHPVFCSNPFSVKVFHDVFKCGAKKTKCAALLFFIIYYKWHLSIYSQTVWLSSIFQCGIPNAVVTDAELDWRNSTKTILSVVRKDLTAFCHSLHYTKTSFQVHMFIRSLKVLQLAAWYEVPLSVINAHEYKNMFILPSWMKSRRQM